MNRHVTRTVAALFAASSVACTTSPDSVQARYISPVAYSAWQCDQLLEERARLTGEVRKFTDLQRENANADAAMMTVGIVLLWPVLFGLAATKDRKEDLARVKGEYEAVDQALRNKGCQIPPPPTDGSVRQQRT
jgi:hypothetical protein